MTLASVVLATPIDQEHGSAQLLDVITLIVLWGGIIGLVVAVVRRVRKKMNK